MDTDPTSGAPAWQNRRGQASALTDLSGDLRLAVGGKPVGVLHVDHGQVYIEPTGDAPVQISVDSQNTLLGVLGGEVHPFVAWLQGRLQVEGDRAIAVRILFGLRAGSPWSGTVEAKPT